jgi:tRNA(Ile)-lysidine synthase
MNDFSKRVLKTIDKYNMIKEGCSVIAAVSGGFDSVCMFHVLHSLTRIRKFSLHVAHVNHSFRTDSDDDENYVIDLCKKLNVKAYIKKADVAGFAKKNKISFETAGREVRYSFFNELLQQIPGSVVATAHNANDNAESFIMHLLRGSGLSGLTGIKAVRGRIIRPLIEQTRERIEQYCKENNLSPRTDYTNFCDDYTRNDIRHNVMPPIAERGGVDAIVRTARLLSDDEEFLRDYTIQAGKKYITSENNKVIIDIKEFTTLPAAIKRRLIRLALENSQKEISLVHIDSIITAADKNYGGKRIVLPGEITATVSRGKLIIYKTNT